MPLSGPSPNATVTIPASSCSLTNPGPPGSGSPTIECSCSPNHAGDGTFCEVTCPASLTADAALPDGAPVLATCGANIYHGAVCNSPLSGQSYVCDDHVWRPVQRVCDVCLCNAEDKTITACSSSPALNVLPVEYPPGTESLDFSHNGLQRLRRDAFWNLANLTELHVNHNKLTVVPPGSFNGLFRLRRLRLQANDIRSFPANLLRPVARTLTTFCIADNRLLADFPMDALAWELPNLDYACFGRLTLLAPLLSSTPSGFEHLPTEDGAPDANVAPDGSVYFPSLRRLYMDFSSMTVFPPWVANMPNLQVLSFAFSLITEIVPGTFRNLPRLGDLNMRFTGKLVSLPSSALAPLTALNTFALVSPLANCHMNADGVLECTCHLDVDGGSGGGGGNSSEPLPSNATAATPTDPPAGKNESTSLCDFACPPLEPPVLNSTVVGCSGSSLGSRCQVMCTEYPSRRGNWSCRFDGSWQPLAVATSAASNALSSTSPLHCFPEPTASPTLSPTPSPTPVPTVAAGGSGSLSSPSATSGSGAAVGGAIGGLLLAVLGVIAVVIVRRRSREKKHTLEMLGELRQLMELPTLRACEQYQTKFAATLGSLAEANARLDELEVAAPADVQLEADTVLGEGEHGRVLLGRLGDMGRAVAVKMLHEGFSGQACVNLLLEARVMAMLSRPGHPHLVRLLAVQVKQLPVTLVMEYCAGGDLRSWLQARRSTASAARPLSPAASVGVCRQVASAVAFLHARMIVHRDLAARNVLVMEGEQHGDVDIDPGRIDADRAPGEPLCKVADLGLSRGLHRGSGDGGGDASADYYYHKQSDDRIPVKWMCPTAVALRRFNKKSDAWSFGVLVWEVFSQGKAPYENLLATEVQVKTAQGYRLPRPEACPEVVYDEVMLACWHKEEAQRPSFRNLGTRLERVQKEFGTGICGGGEADGTVRRGAELEGRARPAGLMPATVAWDVDADWPDGPGSSEPSGCRASAAEQAERRTLRLDLVPGSILCDREEEEEEEETAI